MPTYPGTDGALLHYDVLGDDGAPVVTLAGGAARHPDYLGDLAGLTAIARLHVPHLRGVGRSPSTADPALGSFWGQARDVEQLRLHLGRPQLLLVAHSAGTRLALAYAAQHPDRIAALVLVTPPASHLVDVPSDAERIAARRGDDPDFAAAWAAMRRGPDTSSDEAFTTWQRAVGPVGYAHWGPAEQAHSRVGGWALDAARTFLAAAPPDFARRLARCDAPALVVAGAEDALMGLAPVEALARLLPAGRLVVIDGCGHYPWVEQPAAFRAAVDPFLAAVHQADE